MSAPNPDWRRRALDAEEAIRQLAGWIAELDPEPMSVSNYITDEPAQEAARRAMRNPKRGERARRRRFREIHGMAS